MDAAHKDTTQTPLTRHRSRLWPGVIIGALAGFGVGWFSGAARQHYSPVAEAKVCYESLIDHAESLQPQTREYLKARLYWDAALEIRPGWLDGWHIDFGPVDDVALMGLDPIKDFSSSKEVYEAAMRRHPRSAVKP